MDPENNPLDAGLEAAFGRGPSASVLTVLERKLGEAPRVSLHDEDSAAAGATPLIDPGNEEKRALPQGRGTYHLLGEIARGGMGVVMRGHDTDLGRDVALKVLHKRLADDPVILQRFVEEAQIGGQLQHPGIVPVYELGLMADERPYFTMKLVKGRTLAVLLAERRSLGTERRKLLDVFLSVCQTMAYAHSRGVIHRDLKPANVMVGAFGEVQVVDWGLAKVLARGGVADEKRSREEKPRETVLETVRSGGSRGDGSSSESIVGSVMGTPAYMSPEQAQGLVDRLDERSDVFSLGAILCEILTGRPPYDSEDRQETLARAARGRTELALERLEHSGADPELIELTKECLLVAPTTRPRSAGVLAECLQRHLASVEERAEAARIQAAVERRGRVLTIALATTIVLALVALGGGWFGHQQREIAREREVSNSVNAALNEAAALRGRERWDEARAAVARAESLADGGSAEDSLRASVAEERAEVEAAALAAEASAERERRAAEFLAGLEEIGQVGSSTSWIFDWAEHDGQYAQAFRAFGIDVDAVSPEEASRAIAERGIGKEIVPLLDRWIVARVNRIRRESSISVLELRAPDVEVEAAIRLVDLAHHVDADPLRADLREAMLQEDSEMLGQIASGDLRSQPASTLLLLGIALEFAGDRDTSLHVLRQAARLHPDVLALRTALSFELKKHEGWDRRQALESQRHMEAALALSPSNYAVREHLVEVLWTLAANAVVRGERDDASSLYHEAADHQAILCAHGDELSTWERTYRGLAREGIGDKDGALADYRIVLERGRDRDALSVGDFVYCLTEAGPGLLLAGDLENAERAFQKGLESIPPGYTGYAVRFIEILDEQLTLVRVLQRVRAGDEEAALAQLGMGLEEMAPANSTITRNNRVWAFVSHRRARLVEMCRPAGPAEAERIDRMLDVILDHALTLLEGDVAASPQEYHWNTLGVARLRAGDHAGALEALEESRRVAGSPYDVLFLALAKHGLGEADEARELYEEGIESWSKRPVRGRRWRENLQFVLEARAVFEPE